MFKTDSKSIFGKPVIGVYEHYPLTTSLIKTHVTRRANASIWLVKDTHTAVASLILAAYSKAIILTAIIDKEQLEILGRLGQYAIDT